MDKTVFCPECRDFVTFTVTDEVMSEELKGQVYKYDAKVAYCDKCNSMLYIGELMDENLESLYAQYRLANDIIPLEHVRKIPDMYNIGKKNLSILLGWGENTFSRYYDGDIPRMQYSKVLEELYNDPKYFLDILESNKDLLKESAYKKAKDAVSELVSECLKSDVCDDNKIDYVINYILYKCQDITPLSLQKALYYVQGFFYGFYNRFIFSQDCEAWVHGPVYRSVYSKYKDYGYNRIGDGSDDFDTNVFSAQELAIIDSICRNICCYSGRTLECFTHLEDPWLSARGDCSSDMNCSNEIPKEKIGQYFKDVVKNYAMNNPSDICKYSLDMFSQL